VSGVQNQADLVFWTKKYVVVSFHSRHCQPKQKLEQDHKEGIQFFLKKQH